MPDGKMYPRPVISERVGGVEPGRALIAGVLALVVVALHVTLQTTHGPKHHSADLAALVPVVPDVDAHVGFQTQAGLCRIVAVFTRILPPIFVPFHVRLKRVTVAQRYSANFTDDLILRMGTAVIAHLVVTLEHLAAQIARENLVLALDMYVFVPLDGVPVLGGEFTLVAGPGLFEEHGTVGVDAGATSSWTVRRLELFPHVMYVVYPVFGFFLGLLGR